MLNAQRRPAGFLRYRRKTTGNRTAITPSIDEGITLENGAPPPDALRPGALRPDALHPDALRPDTERLLGADAIRSRIERLTLSAGSDIAILMTGGPRNPALAPPVTLLDPRVRERRAAIRAVGPDGLRDNPPTPAYARGLAEIGAEVRTVSIPPTHMTVYDRRIVLLPADPANAAAGVVQMTGKGAVAVIVALFEQVWACALPLEAPPAPGDAGPSPQERELLKLLAEGLTDARAGRHLGVSPRTVRRMVADMMSRLGARSRFETGLRASERGWI
ncbi:hypothetical protein GCM10017673_21810 [Streptosporangium violaceochromogenes]|nr:hypothetical protein GCM10017673_21810 [Streptosporangium violaceochromogenes]